MEHVEQLRKLASRYRQLAEQTADPEIREDRLRAAALLDREATHTERAFVSPAAALGASAVVPLVY